MKTIYHLGRFTAFFKESSLIVQIVIVISGIVIIAGTATVAAMVSTPTEDAADVSESETTVDSTETSANTDEEPSTREEDEQGTAGVTDTTEITPQASQTTTQQAPTQDTAQSDTDQQEPQAPAGTSYADTYPFASDCTDSPQYTSIQIDPYGYNKCYSSSYTAFKVAQTFGTAPQNWVDPRQWPMKADNANIPRGTTPKLHSVGIQTTGGAGWSVWVETIHDDNTIDISYYNWNNNLSHGTQYNVNPSAFSTYIYFGE